MAEYSKLYENGGKQPHKRFSLNEALNMLQDDMDDEEFDKVDIFIEPPDCQVLTDEDSADEDGVVDNFSGNQLRAPCSVTISSARRGRRLVVGEDDNVEAPSTSTASTSTPQPANKTKVAVDRTFRKTDIPKKKDLSFAGTDRSTWINEKDYSPMTLFELFFDDDVISLIEPLQKAKRWSSEKKIHVLIPMPNAIEKYNANMGGTDRMDQNLGYYRPTIWIRKWWWPIFLFSLCTATQNAWLLYRMSAAAKRVQMDYLAFLRSIATSYIIKYRQRQPRPHAGLCGRQKHSNARWPADIRYDGIGHYLIKAPDQRHCAVCKKNTTKMCSECPRCHLHEKCFVDFHTA